MAWPPSRKTTAVVTAALLVVLVLVGLFAGNILGFVMLHDVEPTHADEPLGASPVDLNLELDQMGKNWTELTSQANETHSMVRFSKEGESLLDTDFLESNVTVYESIDAAASAYDARLAVIREDNSPTRLSLGHEAVMYKESGAVTVLFRDSEAIGRVQYAEIRGFWFEPEAIGYAKRLHGNFYEAGT